MNDAELRGHFERIHKTHETIFGEIKELRQEQHEYQLSNNEVVQDLRHDVDAAHEAIRDHRGEHRASRKWWLSLAAAAIIGFGGTIWHGLKQLARHSP